MADDWCLLSFNISETKHVTKNYTADLTVTLAVLIDINTLPYPLKYCIIKAEFRIIIFSHIDNDLYCVFLETAHIINCESCSQLFLIDRTKVLTRTSQKRIASNGRMKI